MNESVVPVTQAEWVASLHERFPQLTPARRRELRARRVAAMHAREVELIRERLLARQFDPEGA